MDKADIQGHSQNTSSLPYSQIQERIPQKSYEELQHAVPVVVPPRLPVPATIINNEAHDHHDNTNEAKKNIFESDRAKDLIERAFILGVVKAHSKLLALKKQAKREIEMMSQRAHVTGGKGIHNHGDGRDDSDDDIMKSTLKWDFCLPASEMELMQPQAPFDVYIENEQHIDYSTIEIQEYVPEEQTMILDDIVQL